MQTIEIPPLLLRLSLQLLARPMPLAGHVGQPSALPLLCRARSRWDLTWDHDLDPDATCGMSRRPVSRPRASRRDPGRRRAGLDPNAAPSVAPIAARASHWCLTPGP